MLFDRAGTGWSRPVPLPRSAAEVATELHDLLPPGRWILVGHSMGALYAGRFAQLYPSSVRALLLLDPGHEDLFDYESIAAASSRGRHRVVDGATHSSCTSNTRTWCWTPCATWPLSDTGPVLSDLIG